MFIKNLKDCQGIVAGDATFLRELLHPENDGVVLGYSLAFAKVTPGGLSVAHMLRNSTEVYYILNGSGVMSIDDESREVADGDAVLIPPGSIQHIRNTGGCDLEFLCIVSPPWEKKDEEIIPRVKIPDPADIG